MVILKKKTFSGVWFNFAFFFVQLEKYDKPAKRHSLSQNSSRRSFKNIKVNRTLFVGAFLFFYENDYSQIKTHFFLTQNRDADVKKGLLSHLNKKRASFFFFEYSSWWPYQMFLFVLRVFPKLFWLKKKVEAA